MNGYDYFRPTTLDEALEIGSSIPESAFLAGGTDLLVDIGKRRSSPTALISLRNVASLSTVEVGERIRIGGTALLSDLMVHPVITGHFPALAAAIATVGGPQIRNVATLGGNLCNASPAADGAPPLMVYDAVVELRDRQGTREVPVSEFFTGPGETVIRPGEILTALLLTPPAAGVHATYLRKGRVRMDIALVAVAGLLEMENGICRKVRLSAGAVAPTPLRLESVERLLEGEALSDELMEEARAEAMKSVSPITDLRTTAAYRREVVGVYVKRVLGRLKVAGVDHG